MLSSDKGKDNVRVVVSMNQATAVMRTELVRNLTYMVTFGLMSLLMGAIQFQIPGVQGGATDLRELAVLASVLYLTHWVYGLGVALLTAFGTPADGSFLSTFAMHACGVVAAWFFFHEARVRLRNEILFGLVTLVFVVVYYVAIVLPVMAVTNVLAGLVETTVLQTYRSIVHATRFEIAVTAATTTLFAVAYRQHVHLRRQAYELREAHDNIQQSEERYRQLSDLTMEGILRHHRGVAVDLNQSFARMFGYSRDEIIGQDVIELLIPEAYHELIQEKLKLQYTGPYEVEAIRKDGSRFVMEIESRETGPNSPRVAATRDVTERKRAEEALQTRERYLACLSRISLWLLEHLNPDDVLGKAVELLGSTASVSRCFLVKNETVGDTVVGRARHQWCADTSVDGQDPCEHGEVAYASQSLERWAGGLASGKLIASPVSQLPEAERIFLEAEGVQSILIAPLIVTGEWYGFISFEDRITARIWQQELDLVRIAASEISGAIENAALLHEVQNHASQMADQVTERTAELEAANRELKTFTYSVSHDLRAPLRKLDGFSQILLAHHSEQLDEEATEYLRRIRAASQRMGRLIDDLLKLSQVAECELHRQHVDLSAIAGSIANELIHTSRGAELELVIADDLTAEADPGLLRQVMQNLLDNALKFTSKHSRPRIEVGATSIDRDLVYFVKDNGVGFENEHADKLFNVFQRLHSDSEYEGTGVGLATVQRIIERHGGRIWAESSIGEGATFYFTLS
jgi:PAS domain S-box-containing protein